MTRYISLLTLFAAVSVAQTVNTYAGNGVAGYGGDGGPATQAMINRVDSLAVDGAGNVYMADEKNNRVRKIDPNGVMTTLAGTGTAGFSGDGGLATNAQLNTPTGVCTDNAGNVFINDISNYRVRKVSPNGVISTVAGNGQGSAVVGTTFGTLGDGGPATSASFSIVIRCATDNSGNLFVVDQGAHCVRKINAGGTISTFAGRCVAAAQSNGYSGDGGPATSAVLNNPTALAVDSQGNLYITDQFNHRIRKVDASGIITTVFGNGLQGSTGDGGLATSASIAYPGSIVVDAAGVLYVADTNGHKIRKVATNGIVTTIAGNGAAGYGGDGGPALQATINDPFGITLNFDGNVYFADTSNNRIRVILGGATVVPPALTSGALANGATYVAGGLVPGSWAQVKGTSISPVTRIWTDADFVGLGNALPTTLSGVGVKVNGASAAVYYISPTQVSFQVPAGITGTATVQVTRNGVVSNNVTGATALSSPGIFPLIVNGKNYPAGVYSSDSKFTGDPAAGSAFRKASVGETIQLFVTGLVVSPAGVRASAAPVSGVTVTVGGITVPADFAGLVAGAAGEFQINFRVPTLTPGEYPMTISVSGTASPATINSDPPAAIVLPIQ
jgi:uncharacterized protein (TIGR03437 family)